MVKTVKIFTAYDQVVEEPLHCDPAEGMTEQSHKASCDVNVILSQYMKTGVIEQRGGGRYEVLPGQVDYQEALNLVMEAEAAFEDLPAKVRDEFRNRPEELLAFLGDAANRDRAIQMGLIEAPPEAPLEPPLPLEGGGGGAA